MQPHSAKLPEHPRRISEFTAGRCGEQERTKEARKEEGIGFRCIGNGREDNMQGVKYSLYTINLVPWGLWVPDSVCLQDRLFEV